MLRQKTQNTVRHTHTEKDFRGYIYIYGILIIDMAANNLLHAVHTYRELDVVLGRG